MRWRGCMTKRMKKPVNTVGRSIVGAVVLVFSAIVLALDDEMPSDDLLAFIGMFDNGDQVESVQWVDPLLISESIEAGAQAADTQAAKEQRDENE